MTNEDAPQTLTSEESQSVGMEAASPNEGSSAQEAPFEVVDPVAALEQEVAQWKDLAMRKQADLENYRKRMSKEKADAIRYANESLLESLLPVLDNFHFGLDAASNANSADGVLKGMQMILRQFEDVLANGNVTLVPASPGDAFDPNMHEAVAQEASDQVAEGGILRVARKGYRLSDRLIRPASVVVSQGAPKSEASA